MMRAFVVCVGTLLELPTTRARRRVLEFVADKLSDDDNENSSVRLEVQPDEDDVVVPQTFDARRR